jgi:hypothetical protein
MRNFHFEEATMKCVQHSRHGTIFRMPNEDAELLVSSGRYVFISKFAARDATVKPRRRPWLIGAALAIIALAALLWAGTAHAADKPVPFRVCLTQSQAAQVYKGKHLKYRQIGNERCYYAGRTPAKSEFKVYAGGAPGPSTFAVTSRARASASRRGEPAPDHPRAMVAAKPARTETQETRAQVVPVSSNLTAGVLSYQDMMEDAFLALTGRPESDFTFDAYWNRMTGWHK